MAPKKKAGSKSKAAAAAAGGPVPEADGLLTFLQQTLQQLELVSGEADEESRAQLEALKDAFTVPPPGAAGVRQQPGAEVEASEADVEALLNNIEAQLGALESALHNADPSAMRFLSQALEQGAPFDVASSGGSGGPEGLQGMGQLAEVQEEDEEGGEEGQGQQGQGAAGAPEAAQALDPMAASVAALAGFGLGGCSSAAPEEDGHGVQADGSES